MKNLLSLDHIGYAVDNIESSAECYEKAGWILSEIYQEKNQKTQIAFLTKQGFPKIELVSPLDENITSPVDNILKKSGCSVYHVCYIVDDIDQAVEDLYDEGFMPLFEPVKSIAMDNKKICYLFSKKMGLIELVNKK